MHSTCQQQQEHHQQVARRSMAERTRNGEPGGWQDSAKPPVAQLTVEKMLELEGDQGKIQRGNL